MLKRRNQSAARCRKSIEETAFSFRGTPSGAAGLVARIAGDAMAGPDDAGQLLDVDVQQVAAGGMLISLKQAPPISR
jgi:hypothetical protein